MARKDIVEDLHRKPRDPVGGTGVQMDTPDTDAKRARKDAGHAGVHTGKTSLSEEQRQSMEKTGATQGADKPMPSGDESDPNAGMGTGNAI